MSEPDVSLSERASVLTVAGLDPSGGAGLLQDAAAIRAMGVHPLTVLTAVLVQNTQEVFSAHPLDAAVVRKQLSALSREFRIGAVKTGALGSSEIVEALSEWLEQRPRLPLVCDPVFRATSGGELQPPGYRETLARDLFPRVHVLTPNVPEAEALTGRSIASREDLENAALALLDLGPRWVLVTGGHLTRMQASDFLAGPDTRLWMEQTFRSGISPRGTGCALASGLAAGLALGEAVPEAAKLAKQFVTESIDRTYQTGQGHFLSFPPESEE